MKRLLAVMCFLASALFSQLLVAQPTELPTGPSIRSEVPIAQFSTERAKREVAFWREEFRTDENLAACYTVGARGLRDEVSAAADGVDAAIKQLDAAKATTDRSSELRGLRSALEEAESKERAAPAAELDAAKQETEAARKALKAAEADVAKRAGAIAAAWTQLGVARKALDTVVLVRLPQAISLENFEALVRDEARRKKCAAFFDGWLNLNGGKEEVAKAAETHARESHHSDILRKAGDLASSVMAGNAFAERPGSPDRAIFALLNGLGADQKTDGSRVIMTLNLASLIVPEEKEYLELDAFARHLFLQANLPVTSTEDVAMAGDDLSAEDDATADVIRFALKVGGSLLDETDTRLPEHDDCYRLAWVAVPGASSDSEAENEALRQKRLDYMDVCDRIAAHRQRVAWRLGLGLVTEEEDTNVETLAGTLVWGPTTWIYISPFYQRLFRPEGAHTFGGGVSVAFNISGRESGVDAWARIGMDATALGIVRDDDKGEDFEVRFAPTLRVRAFGGTTLAANVGPRFLSSNPEHPDVLASFALTWDADEIIDNLLLPSD